MPAVNSFQIGFIGLGIMGQPISKNLLERVTKAVLAEANRAVDEVTAAGREGCGNPESSPRTGLESDYMLPILATCKEVVPVEDVDRRSRKGSTVIDMSSIAPFTSRESGERVEFRRVERLNAPVSGDNTRLSKAGCP